MTISRRRNSGRRLRSAHSFVRYAHLQLPAPLAGWLTRWLAWYSFQQRQQDLFFKRSGVACNENFAAMLHKKMLFSFFLSLSRTLSLFHSLFHLLVFKHFPVPSLSLSPLALSYIISSMLLLPLEGMKSLYACLSLSRPSSVLCSPL